MKKLLQVEDLNITFKMRKQKLHAVRGVNFSIHEGETLGIVGESGCGKSVTAKSLLRLMPKHYTEASGKILYQDIDLMGFSEKKMQTVRGKEISMIFQDPMTSLNPTLKIGFQILEGFKRSYPGIPHQDALKYAIEMLNLVGIPQPEDRIDEYPHTLSGGMRQRIMIALALASKPKLLIADEPTTALDVTIQAQILDLLKKVQKTLRTSIILITHDLSVVAGFCDRVLVMYAGKIVEEATVDELFSSPKHPYTQRLLQSKPRLDMAQDQPLVPIEGTPPDLSLPLAGCGFCTRCPLAMNICNSQHPPLFEIDKEHRAACWLHDKRAARHG